jgi:UDP-glucose 4-epimerase
MSVSLVVGGTGYVGRELVRQLIGRGDQVSVLSRSQPSYSQVTWLQADLTQRKSVDEVVAGRQFDVIYDVASLPGDTGDPVQMVTVNLLGLTHLLDAARRQPKLRRFVLSSSISAYEWYPATKFQPPDYLPVDEQHPARPRDMYAVTKRMQEMMALTFYHQYGVPVTILRLTAVVGPEGSGGGRSWRDFAKMLQSRERAQIPHFSPEEICHYVDLRDAARMHIVAGEHPSALGEIFNCCGPQSTSGAEFAAILQKLIPSIQVEMGFPWSMAQGNTVIFDMSKAQRLLGFVPEYKLEDSIHSIMQWVGNDELTQDLDSDVTYGEGVNQ